MKIISSAFGSNSTIPSKYTCEGENVNPPLEFADVPKNAKSLVLIMDDPDAPMGTFVHWVLFNIDPSEKEIAENSVSHAGYIGPCPPPASPEQLQRGESGTHRYFFKLYALDTNLNLQNADKNMVEEKMQSHILEKSELIGLYKKNNL